MPKIKFQTRGYSQFPNEQQSPHMMSKFLVHSQSPFNCQKSHFLLNSLFYQPSATKFYSLPPTLISNNPLYYSPQFPNFSHLSCFSDSGSQEKFTIICVPQGQPSTAIPQGQAQSRESSQLESPTSFNNCSFYYSGISNCPSQDEQLDSVPRTAKITLRKVTNYFDQGKSSYSKQRQKTRRKEDAEKFRNAKRQSAVQNLEKYKQDSSGREMTMLRISRENERQFYDDNLKRLQDNHEFNLSPKSILMKSIFNENHAQTFVMDQHENLKIYENIVNFKPIPRTLEYQSFNVAKISKKLSENLETLQNKPLSKLNKVYLSNQPLHQKNENKDTQTTSRSDTARPSKFLKILKNKSCSCNLILTPSTEIIEPVTRDFSVMCQLEEKNTEQESLIDENYEIVELLALNHNSRQKSSHLIMNPPCTRRGRSTSRSKTQSGPLCSVHVNQNLDKTVSMFNSTTTRRSRRKTPIDRQSRRKICLPKFMYSMVTSRGLVNQNDLKISQKLSQLLTPSKDNNNFAEHNYCMMPLTVCVPKQCVSPCSPCRPCTPAKVWKTFQTSCNVGCGQVCYLCPRPCPPRCCPCPRPCSPPPVSCRPTSCCPVPAPLPPPNRPIFCDPPGSPCQMTCSRSCSPARSYSPCSFVCGPPPCLQKKFCCPLPNVCSPQLSCPSQCPSPTCPSSCLIPCLPPPCPPRYCKPSCSRPRKRSADQISRSPSPPPRPPREPMPNCYPNNVTPSRAPSVDINCDPDHPDLCIPPPPYPSLTRSLSKSLFPARKKTKRRRRKRRITEHRPLPQAPIARNCPCAPGCLCPGTLCVCVPVPQCQPQVWCCPN